MIESRGRIFSIAALALLLTIGAPLAEGNPNQVELREAMRLEALKHINRDRAKAGLTPVALDPIASQIADDYCVAQIRNKTTGHFTTDGLTPYMRYSFAGGNDGVSENAAAWSANYRFSDSMLPDMIRRSHDEMMREVPPNDGHRRTILDADATHVGIGLAWQRGEFRMAQEFVRRYLDWEKSLPRTARLGDKIRGAGKPLGNAKIETMSVYFEEVPQSMSPFVASSIENYGYPKKRLDVMPARHVSSTRRSETLAEFLRTSKNDGDLVVREDGTFAISVPTNEGAGIYTVVVWVKAPNGRLVAASNVSIRVEGSGGPVTPMLGTR